MAFIFFFISGWIYLFCRWPKNFTHIVYWKAFKHVIHFYFFCENLTNEMENCKTIVIKLKISWCNFLFCSVQIYPLMHQSDSVCVCVTNNISLNVFLRVDMYFILQFCELWFYVLGNFYLFFLHGMFGQFSWWANVWWQRSR